MILSAYIEVVSLIISFSLNLLMMFRAHMIGQVFVALAWKLNMVLSLKILNANPAKCNFPPYLRVIAVSLLMVLVVKGSRVSMSLK